MNASNREKKILPNEQDSNDQKEDLKKTLHDRNELNNLTGKEWIISTRSVWKYSDYDFKEEDDQQLRYVRKLILFFTKKNGVILNPNKDEYIEKIGEAEEREVISDSTGKVDLIITNENGKFNNYITYQDKFLSEIKPKYIEYFKKLKDTKYLCVILRDFFFNNPPSELVLFHDDLSRLLTQIGYNLKGLTIWLPYKDKETQEVSDSIQHDYILIFKKEKGSTFNENIDIQFPNIQSLTHDTKFFRSFIKSNAPPRDKFKAQHPATFSEEDIKELIKNFTIIDEKPRILDIFSGVGSTLLVCLELGIRGYAIELTQKWIELTRERFFLIDSPIRIDKKRKIPPQTGIEKFTQTKKKSIIQNLISGDSFEKINLFQDNFFDFIVTSPPYWGILNKKIDHKTKKERVDKGLETKYTDKDEDETFSKDLGNVESYNDFLKKLKSIFLGCYNKLKNNGYMAIIVSDFRDGPKFYLYHSELTNTLRDLGFKLIGMTILHQDSKNLYPYGYPYSFVSNIHHQFIIIMKKEIS